MDTFRRLLTVAVFAGLIAGLFITAVHQVSTVPVILEAETYEGGEAAAAHSHDHDHDHAHAADEAAVAHGDEQEQGHEHEGWTPADGLERTFFTGLADVLTGIGFSLLLVAAYVFSGQSGLDWRKGLYWGLAGFAAVTLAPGLGLPPELPGTAAAPLIDRQVWWVATALLTAGGLALIFLGKRALLSAIGLALIVLPHAIGAPQPAEHEALAPASLTQRFAVAATVTSLLFWAALGALTGYFYSRTFKQA